MRHSQAEQVASSGRKKVKFEFSFPFLQLSIVYLQEHLKVDLLEVTQNKHRPPFSLFFLINFFAFWKKK